MADDLLQRQADLERRVDTFIHLKEMAVDLIEKMNEVGKSHQDGSTEKQFRMLITFLWDNGIWEDRIDFDIKPDSGYFEADDYLPIEKLESGAGYSLNFEKMDRSGKNMKISSYIVSEDNSELIAIFDEKHVDSGVETTIPFRQYSIFDYTTKVFNKIDTTYFVGHDLLKRIVGIYLLFKAQEGRSEPRKKILEVLRSYFDGVARKTFDSWMSEKISKTIQLDDIQTLTFEEAVRKIMRKVLFGDNFKDLGKLLKLSRERDELPLAGEEIINKKIMSDLVRRFKNGFLDYLEAVDYESKRLQVISDYELFKAGQLKFEDVEMDIVKIYFPILSTGLSPIEAIGSFFNAKMFRNGDYFTKLVYWFKSELINWIEHKSNPLELIELEKIKKVSLESKVSSSREDERKVEDLLVADGGFALGEITKLDLTLTKKRLLKKAKTDFQKKKIERDFEILKMNFDGYTDEEISKKFGISRRAVFKARELLLSQIRSYLA